MKTEGERISDIISHFCESKADFAIIIGSNELEEKAATVKNMNNGEQKQVPFDNVAEYILSALKNN